MKRLTTLVLFLTLFFGCGGNQSLSDTTSQSSPTFTVSRAPSFAPQVDLPIAVNAQLILSASVALNPTTVNEDTVTIIDAQGTRFPAFVSLLDQSIIIKPKIYLTPNSNFTIIISTGVKSANGLILTRNIEVPFSSDGPSPDITPPTLQARLPNGFTNVDTYSKIYFQFSEPISPLSLTNTTVTAYNAFFDHNITGTARVSGSLLEFELDEPMQPSADGAYAITLHEGSTIQDLAGNAMPTNSSSISAYVPVPDSSRPQLIAAPLSNNTYTIGDTINSIHSDGSTLYIAHNSGLTILGFNLTTSLMTHLASINSSQVGQVYSIDINATTNRAYLATSKGFSILDITNKEQPKIIASFITTRPVYGIDINNNDAFLANSLLGITIVDINNETSPQLLSNFPTTGVAFDLKVSGSNIICAEYDQGAKVYDIQGTLNSTLPVLGHTKHIDTYSSNFIFASGLQGIQYWDLISTPILEIQLASYVSTLVQGNGNIAYANVLGIGIASINLIDGTVPNYFTLNFEATTLTYIADTTSTNEYLIIADRNNKLYSFKVQ